MKLYTFLLIFIIDICKSLVKIGNLELKESLFTSKSILNNMGLSSNKNNNNNGNYSKEDKDKSKDPSNMECQISLFNFSYQTNISFPDFLLQSKQIKHKLNNSELKLIFKFVDSRSQGYFSSKRWDHFNAFFLSEFISCDTNQNCLLDDKELEECIKSNDDLGLLNELYKEELPQISKNVVMSLDYHNLKEINFYSFMIFKKAVIGFRESHIQGLLDQETFRKAFKLVFNQLESVDIDLAFHTGRFLLSKNQTDYFYNFNQFFEISRITNNFLNYDVSISEGYLTSSDMLQGINDVPSKMSIDLFKRYYSLFDENKEIDINSIIDPKALRYQDYCSLEYWANIFSNYTLSTQSYKLDEKSFSSLISDALNDDFKSYIVNSNFQDEKSLNQDHYIMDASDYEFMINDQSSFIETKQSFDLNSDIDSLIKIDKGFKNENENQLNFLETNKYPNSSDHKKRLENNKKSEINKTNINNRYKRKKDNKDDSSQKTDSGENLSTDKADSSSIDPEKLKTNSANYFKILNFYDQKYIYFESFITFAKYLQLYRVMNQGNSDPRGIVKSDIVNRKNDIIAHPPMSITEKHRLSILDTTNCNFMDLLFFVDYMITPLVFKPYITDRHKNFVNEIHLILGLKKMNLYATDDINIKNMGNYGLTMGGKSYDYEIAVNNSLLRKCSYNTALYQYKKNEFIMNEIDLPSKSDMDKLKPPLDSQAKNLNTPPDKLGANNEGGNGNSDLDTMIDSMDSDKNAQKESKNNEDNKQDTTKKKRVNLKKSRKTDKKINEETKYINPQIKVSNLEKPIEIDINLLEKNSSLKKSKDIQNKRNNMGTINQITTDENSIMKEIEKELMSQVNDAITNY